MARNNVIEELLKIVRTELSLLEKKRKIEKLHYVRDVETQHVVERAFQQSIQACIDIGARIVALKNLKTPDTYHDIFAVLEDRKLISKELANRMNELVGLRNVLVHEYRWIRHDEVYRHLQESPSVLKKFLKCVVALV
jgi:uncharacterized protein YutE (UPF0331/DUF86 family)